MKKKPTEKKPAEDIPPEDIPAKEKSATHYTFKKPKFSRQVLDHSIQGLLIFASVFVAFWLSEVRESRKNQKIATNALENIASEMRYNHQQMVRSFNYHYPMLLVLDSIQKNHPETLDELKMLNLPEWRGFSLPMLRSSAYQTMLSSGITKDVPLIIANELALVYNFQTVIERFDDAFITAAGQNPDFVSFESVFFYFGSYFEIIPELLAWYQTFGLKHLKSYGYDLEIEEGKLRDLVELHMGFIDSNPNSS